MKVKLFGIILLILFAFGIKRTTAQVDTSFWFVVPEVDSQHGDAPIYLRISSLDKACTVMLTFPASNTLSSYAFNLAANSTQSINLTTLKSSLETQPNTIENKGIHIVSSNKISVYYEVIGTSNSTPSNSEIFVLKGKFALGEKFYIPIQNITSNSSNVDGYSAFDIVATENNTVVTITPTKNLVGHSAGTTFQVKLNRGQTYSAQAASMLASQHPGGSLVTSDKPVAITVKDDNLWWISGTNCRDLTGDQIVPVNYIGDDYIVMRGYMVNNLEKAVIFGTEANTDIYMKGKLVSSVNAGGIINLDITDNATYIQSSKPIYLMHMSGFGCQLGAPILPSIECTGYEQISFTRATDADFYLNIMTKDGNQDAFTLNGNSSIITASAFKTVPNKTDWVYAQLQFSSSQIPLNTGIIIKNSKGKFQMGMINGTSEYSTDYGYFSGFNQYNPEIESANYCLNQPTSFWLNDTSMLASIVWDFGDSSSGNANTATTIRPKHTYKNTGKYIVTATIVYDCGTKIISDTITIPPDPEMNLPDTVITCGEAVLIAPQSDYCTTCSYKWSNGATTPSITVADTGKYIIKATSQGSCISYDTTIVFNPKIPWKPDTLQEFCTNDSVVLDALTPTCQWSTGETTQTITVNIIGIYTIYAEIKGCKDSADIEVKERKLPVFELADTISFCTDTGAFIGVTHADTLQFTYKWNTGDTTKITKINETGLYSVEVFDDIKCKSSDSIKVTIFKLPELDLPDTAHVCPNDSIKLFATKGKGPFYWDNGLITDTIIVKDTGYVYVKVNDVRCTNHDSTMVISYDLPMSKIKPEEYFCKGTSRIIDAGKFISYLWSTGENSRTITINQIGDYYIDLVDSNNCKNRNLFTVKEWDVPTILKIDTMPNSYITIDAIGGTQPYRYSLDSIKYQASNQFKSVLPGEYIVLVVDTNNCLDYVSISIHDDIIIIPKYFSPNGDNIKDTWDIIGIESYPDASIQIFDRYGKLLTNYRGDENAWDGLYKNNPVSSDDYWYIVNLNNGKPAFTGHLTLIR